MDAEEAEEAEVSEETEAAKETEGGGRGLDSTGEDLDLRRSQADQRLLRRMCGCGEQSMSKHV